MVVGSTEGKLVGCTEGEKEGHTLGKLLGYDVGFTVGSCVGDDDSTITLIDRIQAPANSDTYRLLLLLLKAIP